MTVGTDMMGMTDGSIVIIGIGRTFARDRVRSDMGVVRVAMMSRSGFGQGNSGPVRRVSDAVPGIRQAVHRRDREKRGAEKNAK